MSDTKITNIPLFAWGVLLAGLAIAEPLGAGIAWCVLVPPEWQHPINPNSHGRDSVLGVCFGFTVFFLFVALAAGSFVSFAASIGTSDPYKGKGGPT